ncbi:MAG: bifunctional (p)ppGpp synthetase/guanosine-3',5'-bis(diphosphate) 3'-pyrophosphohydrolase [Armatimonadetes bacterium]|nr:bifunctional (p)ppGpp synthetase/guanosine-3',5'-bis(diphosphate) 3'-pyrophosphohydrolase [Armatimonadota bacterium]
MAIPSEHGEGKTGSESLEALLDAVKERLPDAAIDRIRAGYTAAEAAHKGQTRASGEDYILHPLAVAGIVNWLRMDEDSIIAALLHDVLEDTWLNAQEIRKQFGDEVLRLVEGVTKLRISVDSSATARQRVRAESTRAAESLRKMLMAMAQDVRVMVIKLADRLHNMRTLDALPPERQSRIANETLNVYAPLAGRLGIWQVKWQLEDLCFKVLHPKEFQTISEMVAKSRRERESEVNEAMTSLRTRVDEKGMSHAKIEGRPKHLYSIFNKMVIDKVPFEEIYDLLAIRVIVETQAECYTVLGLVHELWLPIPGLFYDYIAMPKPNGYQSLHTKVIGPGGESVEVQMRTVAMHEVAEYGIAAHWSYKEGTDDADQSDKMKKLRERLFDWSSDSQTSSDFLRTVSSDLFSEQVFVFTPKGDVLDLPTGATPVDFAFRVHTQLGMTVVGAKVNGVMVQLSAKLQNGDVVELITRSNAQPSLDWLEFVTSQHARSKIRTHFRKLNKDVSIKRGKEAVQRELKSAGLDPKRALNDEVMAKVAEKIRGCKTGSDVFAKVGEGLTSVQNVFNKVRAIVDPKGDVKLDKKQLEDSQPTMITSGIDNIMLKRARCCMPLPEEDVVGYVTRGRGIMIHRRLCPNALRFANTEPERLTSLQWPADGDRYDVNLKIVTVNRHGLLMDISTILAESKTNVLGARIKTLPNHTAEINFTIDVRDVQELQDVMNKVGQYSDVISVLRVLGRIAKR